MSRFQNYVKSTPTLAGTNANAHKLLAGRSLGQVGQEYDLSDDDIGYMFSNNPTTNEEYISLKVVINGEKFSVPMSRNLDKDNLENAAYLLDCMFRTSFMSVKDEEGNPVIGNDGKVVLADGEEGRELKAYMSFGKPDGIVFTREEKAFSDDEDDTKATEKAAGLAKPVAKKAAVAKK